MELWAASQPWILAVEQSSLLTHTAATESVCKSAYRGDYQQFLSQYDNLHVEVRDLHVGATGDLGYAAGLELISGTLNNGQKSNVWLRFTSLFRKSGGRWLDFQDHVSVPADIESGKAMLELQP
jgi:ketosteroid isomerase-like protein